MTLILNLDFKTYLYTSDCKRPQIFDNLQLCSVMAVVFVGVGVAIVVFVVVAAVDDGVVVVAVAVEKRFCCCLSAYVLSISSGCCRGVSFIS